MTKLKLRKRIRRIWRKDMTKKIITIIATASMLIPLILPFLG